MIDTACPPDEDLIPVVVGESVNPVIESHIQNCKACRRRIDILQGDLSALRSLSFSSNQPAAASPAPAARPACIGKYFVVGLLDSGGQADVYRAVHPTLDKELAIKLSRRAVSRLSEHRSLLVAEG